MPSVEPSFHRGYESYNLQSYFFCQPGDLTRCPVCGSGLAQAAIGASAAVRADLARCSIPFHDFSDLYTCNRCPWWCIRESWDELEVNGSCDYLIVGAIAPPDRPEQRDHRTDRGSWLAALHDIHAYDDADAPGRHLPNEIGKAFGPPRRRSAPTPPGGGQPQHFRREGAPIRGPDSTTRLLMTSPNVIQCPTCSKLFTLASGTTPPAVFTCSRCQTRMDLSAFRPAEPVHRATRRHGHRGEPASGHRAHPPSRESGTRKPFPGMLVLGMVALVVAGVALLGASRSGGGASTEVRRSPAPTWPKGAVARSESWKAALDSWKAPEPVEIVDQGRVIAASGSLPAFRVAVTEMMRSHTGPPWLDKLVRAVDGSAWRVRPRLVYAKWRGFSAYRRLATYERGGWASRSDLPDVEAALAEVRKYEDELVRDDGARQEDRIRGELDPDGLGYVMTIRDGPWVWLARNGVNQADAAAQQEIGAQVLRAVWPFASKAEFASVARSGKSLFLQLDPDARSYSRPYDWTPDEGPRLLGSVRVPFGAAVETRLAAATTLITVAYDVALLQGTARSRDHLGPAFGFRWGFAFASFPSDIEPLRIPFLRDRGRTALREALGIGSRSPEFGRVLGASLREDIRNPDVRINDLDQLRRAAYEYLAYRLLMNSPLSDPWSKEMVAAMAEGTSLVVGKGKEGVTWADLVGVFEHPDARLGKEITEFVEGLHQFFPVYVEWVLANEPR